MDFKSFAFRFVSPIVQMLFQPNLEYSYITGLGYQPMLQLQNMTNINLFHSSVILDISDAQL